MTEERQLPDRVTMPLLELVTREAVDADYVIAAQRRAAAPPGEADRRRTSLRGVTVVTAVFGLMIALAAVQNSRDADVQVASRQALVDRIEQRRDEVRGLEQRVDSLGTQIEDLRTSDARLRNEVGETTVLLRRLQLSTGFVDVAGPGVRFTIDDNPDGDADGRVRASDLRLLVNGLWQAGAEAIAINGRRLTALSALTNSGIAVGVNRQPLTPPYVVSAIGDSRTLAADLLATSSGLLFQSLSDQFGFVVDPQPVEEIELTAASEAQLRLRWAQEDSGAPEPQPGSKEDLP